MFSNDKEKDIRKILDSEILTGISPSIRDIVNLIPKQYITMLEEIRIRLNKPLMIHSNKFDYMITASGTVTNSEYDAYRVSKEDCEKTIQLLSNYSVYAIEEELKNGYITLKGGHRVGIVGRGIIEGGRVKALKNISGFNVRISRQIIGAADNLIKYIIKNESDIYNTLIISPPQCGKTTLLRDIVRQLSNGIKTYNLRGLKVGLVDERSEIAGSFQGIPQNDVGCRTDVLDACPKSYGLIMLIRSMSPQVIATDEIGSKADIDAIYEAMNAGVRMVTTIHGDDVEDILNRPFINEVVKNRIFERLVVMSIRYGPGTIEKITDGLSFKVLVDKPFR
jgi:stage III sporulation protein AA